jgi:hypothetical protein
MHECIVLTREHNETPQNSAVNFHADENYQLKFEKKLF